MQIKRTIHFLLIMFAGCLPLVPCTTFAYDCATSTMSNGTNCLFYGDMGTVGGELTSATNTILASNMHPWQIGSSDDYWHDRAVESLSEGKNFRDSLLLVGVIPGDSTPLGQMLLIKEQNYETAGFISFNSSSDPTAINSIEAAEKLSSAIATFAYEVHIGSAESEANLLEAIKILANIYLLMGDEFLVDALEWRFSSQNLQLDAKLDEQILLLRKAQLCYDKAVSVFVHGFSPAVGTPIYISDFFNEAVFSLFNLAVERTSVAMREKTAKQLARQLTPTTVPVAMANSKEQLRDTFTSTYLLTAAVAQKQAAAFANNGGERLRNALKALAGQSAKYISGRNPLGFDDRYIPMQDFSILYNAALVARENASSSNSAFLAENREFDSQIDALKNVHNSMATNVYRTQLASLTGMDIALITPTTLDQVSMAGEDLYDCDIDAEDFSTCVQGKTGGVLGSKYREIRSAHLRVEQALLRRTHALESIEMENTRFSNLLQIEHQYTLEYTSTLQEFYKKLKGARSITRTIEKTKGQKNKEKKTVTSYSIEDPQLRISTDREIRLQELLQDYKIKNIELNHEVDLMNLLHSLAEIETEIGLAVQVKNSAIDDFDNTLKERDNLVFLYQKANEYYQDSESAIIDKMAEARILRSEAAIKLANDLNVAIYRTYLAAKALEYKYLTPLVNVSLGVGTLNISDLYKIQTVDNLDTFLTQLNGYDTCSWGSVSPRLYRISLARDILGLTDSYLEALGAMTTADKNKKRTEFVQQFLSEKIDTGDNSLAFPFSISLTDKAIAQYRKYNMKIWWGAASLPCDPVTARGVAVQVLTTQAANIEPYVLLRLRGEQTFLKENKEIISYVPVSKYLNMQSIETDGTIVTTGGFNAFVNSDPASYDYSEPRWSNSFKGRSLAAANWELIIEDFATYADDIDWSKVSDINLYFETMAMQLPVE